MVYLDELLLSLRSCYATLLRSYLQKSIFLYYFSLSSQEVFLWKNVIFALSCYSLFKAILGLKRSLDVLSYYFWHFTTWVNGYATSADNLIRCSTMILAIRRAHCLWSFIIYYSSFIIKYSPVPELSFLPAPYRDWPRAGERRVQDNFHAHDQNEAIFPPNRGKNHIWKYFPDSACGAIFWIIGYKQQFSAFRTVKNISVNPKSVEFQQFHAKRL